MSGLARDVVTEHVHLVAGAVLLSLVAFAGVATWDGAAETEQASLALEDVSCVTVEQDSDFIQLEMTNEQGSTTFDTATVLVYTADNETLTRFKALDWLQSDFTAPGSSDTVVLQTAADAETPVHLTEQDPYRVEVNAGGTTLTGSCIAKSYRENLSGDGGGHTSDEEETGNRTGNQSTEQTGDTTSPSNISLVTVGNDTSTDNASASQYNDSTPPTTADDYDDDGWQQEPQTVNITCEDTESGCHVLQWAITRNGNVIRYNTSANTAASITVGRTADGVLTLHHRAADRAGNIASWKTQTVRVDTTPPATAITRPPNGTGHTGNFTVYVNDTDNTGFTQCAYRIADTGTGARHSDSRNCPDGAFRVPVGPDRICSTDGIQTCHVTVNATDNAGNAAETRHRYTVNYTAENASTGNKTENDTDGTDDWSTYSIGAQQDWEQGVFNGTTTADNTLTLGYHNQENNLVAYWPFDELSGQTVHDRSGNGHDGATENFDGDERGETGVFGSHAFYFDGATQDGVQVPGSSVLDIDRITISAWVKPEILAAADSSHVFNRRTVTYSLTQYPDGEFLFITDTRDDGGQWQSVGYMPPETDIWYHLVGTYDGSEMRLYVNGTLVDTAQQSGAVDDGGSSEIGIGVNSNGDTQYFNGSIDELRLYDQALHDTAVRSLYLHGEPFTGSYTTERIDTGEEQSWGTLYVNASLPDGTQADATVTTLDSTGDTVDSHQFEIDDGARNYTVDVADSEDARIQFSGASKHPETTWRIHETTLYYTQ